MDTLANSEDLDEMQHHATFYQGLNCLKRKKRRKLHVKNVSYFRNFKL